MTGTAIEVVNLTKKFKIPLDRSSTLKYRATHLRSSARYRELLALHDVSFEVPEGQFLGIAGPNGCGKSTLLKILSRIYGPDQGSIAINGRVSPFLELGVAINPELTARENIFLGGAVLGLTRKQLASRVDEVLDFAELRDFSDQKLKNFSSGMSVRLAFSVAIQADADILMDEVLAVGDARFQAKCFDVFAEYKRQKRTIVLVSHDLASLGLYCDRVLLIENGRLISDGAANDVISEYRRIVNTDSADAQEIEASADSHVPSNRFGTREVEITGVRLLGGNGDGRNSFMTGEEMTVAVDYSVNAQVDEFTCGLAFRRADGMNLSGPNTKAVRYIMPGPPVGTQATITYTIPDIPLLGAKYLVDVALYDGHLNHAYDHIEDATRFHVSDELGRYGMVDLGGSWQDSFIEARVPKTAVR